MYALVFVAFLISQDVYTDGGIFKSEADCLEAKANVVKMVPQYNASAQNPVKITHYVAACLPLEKAPQGKAI